MTAEREMANDADGVVRAVDQDHVRRSAPSTPPVGATGDHSFPSQPSSHESTLSADAAALSAHELNQDRLPSTQVVPASMTPPPSSHVPQASCAAGLPLGYVSSHRSCCYSPPATSIDPLRRNEASASDYIPPTAEQIDEGPVEELRRMFKACVAENARLKMERAHHKLQYSMLSMQADEDAKRAAVEHDMFRREVEVLRRADDSRQAPRKLKSVQDSAQAKYIELKARYEAALEEKDGLRKRSKLTRKVIQQKEDKIMALTEERDMLLNRIRENREHFHMLCSPGGAFHGVLTPKVPTVASPPVNRATSTAGPRLTPRSHVDRDGRQANDSTQAGFAALLQALSHENGSAPTTPVMVSRPAARTTPKHVRGAQSLSALPITPGGGPPVGQSLLPSAEVHPQAETLARADGTQPVAHNRVQRYGRKSRESTISAAEEDEVVDRAALESVAARTQKFMSQASRAQASAPDLGYGGAEAEAVEQGPSQAASELLRRTAQESIKVASTVREVAGPPARNAARYQARLFGGVTKIGVTAEKRKGGCSAGADDGSREAVAGQAKKVKHGGDGDNIPVGLGIQYDRGA